MRYLRLSSFLLAAAVVTAGDLTVLTGVRKDTPWSQYLIAAVQAHGRGLYPEAVIAYENAIRLMHGDSRQDRLELAYASNGLGVAYYALGRYQNCEPLYQQALAIRRELLGPSDPQTAVVLSNLGDIRMMQGKYDDAVRFATEALQIDRSGAQTDGPKIANDLNNLGVAYAKQGKLGMARKTLQNAADMAASYTPPDARLPDYLGNLATTMMLSGSFEDAERTHNRVLEMQETARGRNHPSVALTMLGLSDCAIHLKRYASALVHAQAALKILQARLGEKHPNTMLAYFAIAVACERMKRPDLAEPAVERVLEFDKDAPVEPLFHIIHLREYARILRLKGEKEQARDVDREAEAVAAADPEQVRSRNTVDVEDLKRD